MARRKMIEDKKLLELIEEYHALNCAHGSQKIRLPLLAEYIVEKGYPGYRVETLRRNENARAYIDTLNRAMQDEVHQFVITYKTLDVENFLESNRTQASLRTALATLDAYYRDVSTGAGAISKKYKELQRDYEDALTLLKRKDEEIASLTEKVKVYREHAINAEAEKKRLKTVVTRYVYPDIANSLLAADGDLINAKTIIDPEKLDVEMISASTKVEQKPEVHHRSSAVRHLYESFECD